MSPEVVCLCGSTKFKEAYLAEQERLTLEGKIFVTVGFYGHVDGWPEGASHDRETKDMLDELHKRKIDLADRVHVINVNGYVGDSTDSEIKYAHETGTEVTWLEDPDHEPGRPLEDEPPVTERRCLECGWTRPVYRVGDPAVCGNCRVEYRLEREEGEWTYLERERDWARCGEYTSEGTRCGHRADNEGGDCGRHD